MKRLCSVIKEPLSLATFRHTVVKNLYFIEYVKQIFDEYATDVQELYTTGLNIKTTINLKMTELAYEAMLKKASSNIRKGIRQPRNFPEVALIAIEVKSGEIKVMIGRNLAIRLSDLGCSGQKRQPGHLFKLTIYLAALERGLTPDYISVRCSPYLLPTHGRSRVWQPRNYRNEYHGNVTMRRARTFPNTATARLLEKPVWTMLVTWQKGFILTVILNPICLWLSVPPNRHPDLACAYATFARGGAHLPCGD